jgi:hypothetical protein
MTRVRNAHNAALAALFASFLICAVLPGTAADGSADDIARILAGIEPRVDSPLAGLTRDSDWRLHASSFDAAWKSLEARQPTLTIRHASREPGGFGRFLGEAAQQLGRMHANPRTVPTFAGMPVVIVAYSGGYDRLSSSVPTPILRGAGTWSCSASWLRGRSRLARRCKVTCAGSA